MGCLYILSLEAIAFIVATVFNVDVVGVLNGAWGYATGTLPVDTLAHPNIFGLVAAIVFWLIFFDVVIGLFFAFLGLKLESKLKFEDLTSKFNLMVGILVVEDIVFRGFFTGYLDGLNTVAGPWVFIGGILFALAHLPNFSKNGFLALPSLLITHYLFSYLMVTQRGEMFASDQFVVISLGVVLCILTHLLYDLIVVINMALKEAAELNASLNRN